MWTFVVEKLEDGKYKHAMSLYRPSGTDHKAIWESMFPWCPPGKYRIYIPGDGHKTYFEKN